MMNNSDKNTLMALIFNNLGCYYKKNKKPKVALQYMLNALQLEELIPVSKS